jgi:hypothetical protein
MTPVVHLELRISPRIFEKIRNGPNGIFRGLGKLIYEKTKILKSLGPVPFFSLFFFTFNFNIYLLWMKSSRVSEGLRQKRGDRQERGGPELGEGGLSGEGGGGGG